MQPQARNRIAGGLFLLGVVGMASRADAVSRVSHGTTCVSSQDFPASVTPNFNGVEVTLPGLVLCPLDRHDGGLPISGAWVRMTVSSGTTRCRVSSQSVFGVFNGVDSTDLIPSSGTGSQSTSITGVSGLDQFTNGSFVLECGPTSGTSIIHNIRFTE
jgi:hypothetical protein